jgi:hypothetical protein
VVLTTPYSMQIWRFYVQRSRSICEEMNNDSDIKFG